MELADTIRLQPFWTFNDVRKLAITIEQQRMKYSSKAATKASSSNQGSIASSSNKSLVKGATSSKNEVKGDGVRLKHSQIIPMLPEGVLNAKVWSHCC